ncbi:MAG TPA: SprT family zinc-dependent metalloprotease [Nitrososphaeraceae archaeon]|nr:SprT family zinc-dependent metalloprotease [Nitrososphaeraceae archaeon]
MIQRDKVRYGTITIPYHVIKTSRIKTSEVIVDADTITVRVPFDKDKPEIQKLVLDKASWILKKQKEYRETTPEIIKPSFKENTILPYLGNNYSLKINKNQARNSIGMDDGKFLVQVKTAELSSSVLKGLYENWLEEKAQEIFEDKVKKYSKKIGVLTNQVVIKNLRNRWGSLTKNGVLNLNPNLIKAPENIIDYIILHELCHLRIKEHSHHYWDMLHKFMPNYHDKVEWLKVNGNNLL